MAKAGVSSIGLVSEAMFKYKSINDNTNSWELFKLKVFKNQCHQHKIVRVIMFKSILNI